MLQGVPNENKGLVQSMSQIEQTKKQVFSCISSKLLLSWILINQDQSKWNENSIYFLA